MKFKELHRNVKIRLITQFFTRFSNMMVLPFLAVYFAQKVGEVVTGLMVISLIGFGIAGGIIGGFSSDRIGRKRLMVWSEVGAAIAFLAIACMNSPWFDAPYATFGIFIVAMFFGGVIGPVSQAMVLDVTFSENRRYVFTLLYWVGNMASAIAGVVGALLFQHYLFQLFLSISAVSLLSAIITQLFITESYIKTPIKPSNPEAKDNMWTNYKTVFGDRIFVMLLFAAILVLSLEEQLTNFLGLHFVHTIETQKLSNIPSINVQIDGLLMIGILRSENTFLVVFAASFITWFIKRWSNHTVLVVGLISYTVGYALFIFVSSPLILIGLMAIVTIGELMYIPIKQSMLADLAPEDKRSSYLAAFQFTGYIAMLVAALGVVISGLIPAWAMGVKYVVLGSLGLILFLKVNKNLLLNKQKIKEEQTERVEHF
ncbi:MULTISPECIES: MFS transporter [Pontibacillus]|uniref:MFS transporter n=1 Tax=Pontibacillus chungwhensis TaxID=265426 RepID=A0ABY8UWD6_9BACI|nr:MULTISPECIES: MFS transporter [Pontibacillus]MCD5323303.1 MFS transporter [Pontibacillus sp. HN14]WIF96684.1 MFS transporter [Pontibacillus chungwhensis]